MADEKPPSTFSISVRVRRMVTEAVHMSVLVTNELMKPDPEPDGTYRIDVQKVFAAAVEQARAPATKWQADGEPQLEVHPLQTPP